jgi:hypothetical protein
MAYRLYSPADLPIPGAPLADRGPVRHAARQHGRGPGPAQGRGRAASADQGRRPVLAAPHRCRHRGAAHATAPARVALLLRRGRGPDDALGSDPFAAEAPLLASAMAAVLQGRVALGPRAGQPVRRLRSAVDAIATGRRSARLEGFSLHADVAVPARRRDQLEKLCRYLVRPQLAGERLTESTGGQLLYHFRRPWRDGSTALLLDPLELLARLAALVPPPRRPLLAYHGLLAPRAR